MQLYQTPPPPSGRESCDKTTATPVLTKYFLQCLCRLLLEWSLDVGCYGNADNSLTLMCSNHVQLYVVPLRSQNNYIATLFLQWWMQWMTINWESVIDPHSISSHVQAQHCSWSSGVDWCLHTVNHGVYTHYSFVPKMCHHKLPVTIVTLLTLSNIW